MRTIKTGTSKTIVNGKYVSNQTIGTYLGYGGEKGQTPRYVIMVEIAADGKDIGGPISFAQAALGDEITVPGLREKINYKIPWSCRPRA